VFKILNVVGGAKKRKKKTYSKPKKRKHTHKKVKLRLLKYYQVDADGTVVRLRQECPQCGPGVYMAKHKNRVSCGRCSMTEIKIKHKG
jgi:small subunit ribosomal protein S27Ae